MKQSDIKPLKIEVIENVDISDAFCKNELIEYFNKLIIKHGRLLKKEGTIIIYKEDFITFPSNDIIECVVDLFYNNGFAIYFYETDTNETKLYISTNKDDLYDEFYEIDYKQMVGIFNKVKTIHKTCDDWRMCRKWIEISAVQWFWHNNGRYQAINVSEIGFNIIKIEDKKPKDKKSIFDIFKS